MFLYIYCILSNSPIKWNTWHDGTMVLWVDNQHVDKLLSIDILAEARICTSGTSFLTITLSVRDLFIFHLEICLLSTQQISQYSPAVLNVQPQKSANLRLSFKGISCGSCCYTISVPWGVCATTTSTISKSTATKPVFVCSCEIPRPIGRECWDIPIATVGFTHIFRVRNANVCLALSPAFLAKQHVQKCWISLFRLDCALV